IVVENGEMQIINLADVAQVEQVEKDMVTLARSNGNESLMVSVQKEGSANTADVSEKVREKLSEMEKENAAFDFVIASDQGSIVENSVANVSTALIFGGIFAIAIILAFLRSVGSTLIVSIAIPFSVISTFVLMYFSGLSLNIMSLGGLALGVGMLVDNAIVVIENIYRHMSIGKSRIEAAIGGATEVAGAITSSTLTTMAVFLPVIFIGGLVGEIFKELAITVAFSLAASLIVALTVIPALAAMLMHPEKIKPKKESVIYRNIITWSLGHRAVTLGLTVLLVIGSFSLVPLIGTEFMPTQDEGMFSIEVKLPEGSTIDRTLGVVKEIETAVMGLSEVDNVTASIGSGDVLYSDGTTGENTATVSVILLDQAERSKSTEKVMQEIEGNLVSLSKDAEINFKESSSMEAMSGTPSTVEVMITGENSEKIKEYSDELTSRLEDIREITKISNSLDLSKPIFQFNIDKEKAFQNGFTSYQIASFVNQSLNGEVATKLSTDGLEKDVRVKIANIGDSKEAIENLSITAPTGKAVLLKNLGTVVRTESPVSIVRDNQHDVLNLYLGFTDSDLGSVSGLVQTEIDQMVEDLKIDESSYDIKLAGGTEMMTDAFGDLTKAMILAVIFVYMIMASLFGSFIYPLIILFSLPFALTGVTGGLMLTGYSFGITAFIGIIVLAGIVVNNAIVFVDYTNKLMKQGMAVREALIQAGLTRLRPILMTALTTMLGLLPLAAGLGEGAEIQAPMAIVVIGGLFTSTILTLVVIPVVFSLVENFKGFRNKVKFIVQKLDEYEDNKKDIDMVTAK
ncbi:MAG: efflux RND transporter permease subunit, partial [Eubacteriales bacterium]